MASLVCPNETELAVLTQKPAKTLSEIEAAAHRLRGMGAARVLVTLGERGILLVTEKDGEDHVLLTPSSTVEKVVDTSGAGDCFIGSLAAYLSNGVSEGRTASSGSELGKDRDVKHSKVLTLVAVILDGFTPSSIQCLRISLNQRREGRNANLVSLQT